MGWGGAERSGTAYCVLRGIAGRNYAVEALLTSGQRPENWRELKPSVVCFKPPELDRIEAISGVFWTPELLKL